MLKYGSITSEVLWCRADKIGIHKWQVQFETTRDHQFTLLNAAIMQTDQPNANLESQTRSLKYYNNPSINSKLAKPM